MDPTQITTQWSNIGTVQVLLWLLLLFVIGLASNMLLAQGLIPSLIATRHLPRFVERTRRIFYIGALVALAGIATIIQRFVAWIDVLNDVYPRWWI